VRIKTLKILFSLEILLFAILWIFMSATKITLGWVLVLIMLALLMCFTFFVLYRKMKRASHA
jgi:hypothetical protein